MRPALSVRPSRPTRYRLWGRAEGQSFVDRNFDPEVAWAFRCLRPYAYKADLLKFCVLHVYGGWYVDAGVRILRSPAALFDDGSAPQLVLFRSTGSMDAPWNCSLALLYAEAGNSVFTVAIDEVVANCRAGRYGATPLSPTMSSFGRAIARQGVESGVRMGVVVDVEGREFRRGFELAPLGLVAAASRFSRLGKWRRLVSKGATTTWPCGTHEVYGWERPPGAGPAPERHQRSRPRGSGADDGWAGRSVQRSASSARARRESDLPCALFA